MVGSHTQCWPLHGHGARAVCEAQGARRGARGGCGDAAGRAPAPLAAPAGGEVQPGQSAEDIELLKRAAMPTVSSWAESCRAVPCRATPPSRAARSPRRAPPLCPCPARSTRVLGRGGRAPARTPARRGARSAGRQAGASAPSALPSPPPLSAAPPAAGRLMCQPGELCWEAARPQVLEQGKAGSTSCDSHTSWHSGTSDGTDTRILSPAEF